ncbi:MAG: UDP-N-acetylglucosamine 2-epimerase (non-hydrolyzing) [Sphingomicrobium sp.]
MRFADIRLVVGTRPEAIKLSPVAHALAAHGHEPRLIFTGQHPLDPWEFGLGAFAIERLKCPGEENPHAHVHKVAAAIGPRLATGVELLVVQGDTSSALGASLAAFRAGVPLAHVEAGLRTHDLALPWPEEEYRTAIDGGAQLLFAPTELSARNLAAEGVGGEVHVTGNPGIDAVFAEEARLPPRSLRENGRRVLVTCHRRESWGEGLRSISAALAEIARSGRARIDVVLPPNGFIAQRMRTLLEGHLGVTLVGPLTHRELVERMLDCDLVLSDSGGIQEEAPTLGVPLLVLRDKTERPEGLADGSALLVGTSAERIVAQTFRLLDDPVALAAMSRRSFPYGDGHAAERIATIIGEWVEQSAAAWSAARTGRI